MTHFGIKYAFVDEPGCCHRGSEPTLAADGRGQSGDVSLLWFRNLRTTRHRLDGGRAFEVEVRIARTWWRKKEQLTKNSHVLWNSHSLLCLNCFDTTILRGKLFFVFDYNERISCTCNALFCNRNQKIYTVTSCQNAATLIRLVYIYQILQLGSYTISKMFALGRIISLRNNTNNNNTNTNYLMCHLKHTLVNVLTI